MTEWITAIAAIAAVIISLAALAYARSSARASMRSAIAAEAAAAAADRQAAAAERDERRQLEEAEAAAVRWTTERLGTAVVSIRNAGTQTAHDVHVTIPPGTEVSGRPAPAGVTVPSGGHVLVGVSKRMGTPPDARIAVRWRAATDGPVRDWDQPLP